MRVMKILFLRDVGLFIRGNSTGLTLAFFFIAVAFLPFGLGPDLGLLQKLAPGLVWVGLCLSVLLSLEHLFQSDIEDGSFDQLMLGGLPLEMICLTKALAHWAAVVMPLILMSPVAGLFLNISPTDFGLLVTALLSGSLALSFLGMVGAALAASVVRSGFLAALLVMPLYVPVLIFGSAALVRGLSGDTMWVELTLLGLFGLSSMLLAPLAAALALRARMG